MIKLELIHNKQALSLLKELLQVDKLHGFTCLNVYEGYGPFKGGYKNDHISDDQFYTIVLIEEKDKAEELVRNLRSKAPNNKIICLSSDVSYSS